MTDMKTLSDPVIRSYGTHAILVEWDQNKTRDRIELSCIIYQLAVNIKKALQRSVTDVIPASSSLCIELSRSRYKNLVINKLHNLIRSDTIIISPPRVHHVPVQYYDESHEDVNRILKSNKLCYEELINIHQSRIYKVLSLGFMPGFVYLAYTDTRLYIGRKETPRLSVTAGSIGLADDLCCIYPHSTPGGWHLIGETKYALFDLTNGAQLLPGDEVIFKVIT